MQCLINETLHQCRVSKLFCPPIKSYSPRNLEFASAHFIRCISGSERSSKVQVVTAPLFYVNSRPHIGHVYSSVLADSIARWFEYRSSYRSSLGSSYLVVGSDEHGSKILESARKAGVSAENHCSLIHAHFLHLYNLANVQHSACVRTTSPHHEANVCSAWKRLEKAGHIYAGEYTGWYSVPDESYVGPDELEVRDGERYSKLSGHRLEQIRESTFYFRLSAQRERILDWLRRTQPIRPLFRAAEVERWLSPASSADVGAAASSALDLCVTRPTERVPWGIRVPDRPEHTIYVWFEALLGYLTACMHKQNGEQRSLAEFQTLWPPAVQVIGKDILRFHAVIWPAILFALGLEPPEQILCHGHWLVGGGKISKSRPATHVDPFALIDRLGADPVRYYLLHDGATSGNADVSFSEKRLVEVLNSELADCLGNLVLRVCSPAINPSLRFPLVDAKLLAALPDERLAPLCRELGDLRDRVARHYDAREPHAAIAEVHSQLLHVNAVVQQLEHWKLAKTVYPHLGGGVAQYDPTKAESRTLECLVGVTLESIRLSALLLQPVVPELAARLLNNLAVPRNRRTFEHTQFPDPQRTDHISLRDSIRKPLFYKIKQP